ncbi:MAG: hypothetical protein ACRDRP_22680, partial [Pseudonocardiaceae bacterium]
AWLADQPHARRVIRSVWDTLAELERAGHHPDPLAALRDPDPAPAHRNGPMPHLQPLHLASPVGIGLTYRVLSPERGDRAPDYRVLSPERGLSGGWFGFCDGVCAVDGAV